MRARRINGEVVLQPQAKDIPDGPVLAFLLDFEEKTRALRGPHYPPWCTWFGPEYENSVQRAMPPGMPDRLVLAKMRILIRRGLVDGCDCGCRGDFVLTERGRALALTVAKPTTLLDNA